MDDFLTKIYHEERTKTAGAELDRYLSDLPADVLLKIAVAGTPHPELPDSLPDGEFKRLMDSVSEHVNREHLSAVPTRKETSSVSSISFQGEGKQPVENQDEALRHSKTASVAKQIIRKSLGHAAGTGAVGAGIGALTGEEGDRGRRALKGALIGGGMSLGNNAGLLGAASATKAGRSFARMAVKHPDKMSRIVNNPTVQRASKTLLPTLVAGSVGGTVAGGIAGAKIAPKKKQANAAANAALTAIGPATMALGTLLGYHKGKALRERGDDEPTVGGTQIAKMLFIPGGIGHEIGRHWGWSKGKQAEHEKKKTSGLTKECSATAQEKAKIAMRAIKVTRGASPQVKLAAAVFAGNIIAKV